MRILLIAIMALTLSSCSLSGIVASKGADANDDAIEAALFTLCQGASIGSINRKFDTPERADVLAKLCTI